MPESTLPIQPRNKHLMHLESVKINKVQRQNRRLSTYVGQPQILKWRSFKFNDQCPVSLLRIRGTANKKRPTHVRANGFQKTIKDFGQQVVSQNNDAKPVLFTTSLIDHFAKLSHTPQVYIAWLFKHRKKQGKRLKMIMEKKTIKRQIMMNRVAFRFHFRFHMHCNG